MRNPPWIRDELIICLDAYLGMKPKVPSSRSDVVSEVSDLLRRLAGQLGISPTPTYRSPASVVMKMMNFRSIDPDYKGVGLLAGGGADREVWNTFATNRDWLTDAAAAVRDQIASAQPMIRDTSATGIAEAIEGRLLTLVHLRRERDPRLSHRKKTAFRRTHGRLFCEACGFDFERIYGPRGAGFIECHHVTPLREYSRSKLTRLEDLALLCANCHRIVHVSQPWLSISELKTLLAATSSSR